MTDVDKAGWAIKNGRVYDVGRKMTVADCRYACNDGNWNIEMIAAAPDLLKALEDCVDQIKALCDVPDGAEAAIRKARGR